MPTFVELIENYLKYRDFGIQVNRECLDILTSCTAETDGLSGAAVFRVEGDLKPIITKQFDNKQEEEHYYIIKIDTKERALREYEIYKEFRIDTYWAQRLPSIARFPENPKDIGTQLALFQTTAGGSPIPVVVEDSPAIWGEVFPLITNLILNGNRKQIRNPDTNIPHPSDVLQSWLNYPFNRLDTKKIDIFLGRDCDRSRQFDPRNEAQWKTQDGHTLPNPLFYALDRKGWAAGAVIGQWGPFPQGYIHGDMHPKNVLVRRSNFNGPYDLRLVDLENGNKHGYLFFDNAYFELSYLLNHTSCAEDDIYNICRWLNQENRVDVRLLQGRPCYAHYTLLKRGRQTLVTWFNPDREGLKSGRALNQWLLAGVAAGLNMSFKSKIDRQKDI